MAGTRLIEFTSDFRMNYVLGEGGMQNTVSQSYHIEDDYIYGDPGTDEKVKYRIEDDKLILFTGNIINEFVKQE